MFCFTFDNSRFISPEKTIEKTVVFRRDSKPSSFCPLFSPPLSTRVKPSGWGEGVWGMFRSRNLLKHLFHLHSTNYTGCGLGFVTEISPLKFKIWSRYDQEKYMIVTKKEIMPSFSFEGQLQWLGLRGTREHGANKERFACLKINNFHFPSAIITMLQTCTALLTCARLHLPAFLWASPLKWHLTLVWPLSWIILWEVTEDDHLQEHTWVKENKRKDTIKLAQIIHLPQETHLLA